MIWYLIYFIIFIVSLWVVFNALVDHPHIVAAKKQLVPDFGHSSHPEVAQRLVTAISFRSISSAADTICVDETAKLLRFLEEQFPLLHGGHELVTVEKVNEYSRLFTVRGSDPQLKGYLLNAHTDVVPTENQQWTQDPFNTGILDGFIWGRGAIDDKGSVLSIMEALSYLLKNGFKPKRTIYIAICHDEEVAGTAGAKAITELLLSRKAQVEFVHDEGMMILNGLVPGLRKEIALIGVSEKGYVDVEISLNIGSAAGHSAAAKPGLGVLGKLGAVAYAAEKQQMKMHLNAATIEMFHLISSEMNLPGRIVLRNMRFFWPIVRFFFGRTVMAGLFRTTSVVSLFSGGVKHNVLPSEGKLAINHRIHPEDTVSKVVARDTCLCNDPQMQVTLLRPSEPHPIAPFDSRAVGYHVVKAAIEQSIGADKVLVVPGLMVAASDSRHYLRLTPACYRFLPTRIKLSESHRYHGADEKISLENYEETINFYVNLFRNADAAKVDEIYGN